MFITQENIPEEMPISCRIEYCKAFAKEHGLTICSIMLGENLWKRLQTESFAIRTYESSSPLPKLDGDLILENLGGGPFADMIHADYEH